MGRSLKILSGLDPAFWPATPIFVRFGPGFEVQNLKFCPVPDLASKAINRGPILPPELEREIFERAACMCPGDIPSLLLVSQRVNEWIAPIRYRTVTSDGAHSTFPFRALQRAIQSNLRPLCFFRAHVRHLTVPYSFLRDETSETVEQIISACSGIQYFVFIHQLSPSLVPALANLRPHRLYTYLDPQLFAYLDPQLFVEAPLYRPMFTFVTHLALWHVTSSMSDTSRWLSFLAFVPSLTHLLIHDAFEAVPHILAASEGLKVLIDYDYLPYTPELDNAGSDDRFVFMKIRTFVEDWVRGTRGEMDYWARADMFVAKKRRGEIQPKTRCWIEKADEIPGTG
ncbi:hypothetical protein C8F04DRAFT_1107766 [Mycena alexandri]|uniref:Uncharacterized protein n=1 Tax=Mycena alexandri TaxID=1745969 RepID=A0AAD6SQL0_9AGAR|nr:hypothetical protein C8F04DRAFT_1107766 [Mycena alexandri]